jgi:hypothetical protein
MSDVETILAEAGARWRASLPPEPDVNQFLPALRAARPARWRRLVPVAVGLAVVGFLGVRTLTAINGPTGPGIGAGPARALAAGDAVWGYGSVMIDPNLGPVLCRSVVVSARIGGGPNCSPNHIVLAGVQGSSLPGSHDIAGIPVADGLIVRGHWTGTVLAVDSIEQGAAAVDPTPAVTCTAPAEGWASPPASAEGLEQAGETLQAAVDAQPDHYSGSWTTNTETGTSVAVVGTLDDPASARDALQKVYPYPLCVVSAQYSQQAMNALMGFFTKSDFTWQAAIDPKRDRLVVDLPFIDPAAESLFAAHPEAVARPLIARQ